MIMEISGKVWYWKGPAPFYFVTVPKEQADKIKEIASLVTYGWGMIPVNVRVGQTDWYTALWPKDGQYVLPLKDKIRKAEKIEEGDTVTAWLDVAIA